MRRTLVLALLVTAAGCSPPAPKTVEKKVETIENPAPAAGGKLTGGGSSAINPLMKKWSGAYNRTKGIQIDYTSSGSGNGISQMIGKQNDFGCTDAPMSDENLAKAKGIGGDVVHVPLVIGGVVPIYNVKNVQEPLHFSGPVLAEIFMGDIKRWDDAKLKQLNPGVELPGDDITVVFRADPSGTTYIWSDYLGKVSEDWKKRMGPANIELKWPTGTGAQKTDAVASQVKRVEGAIGYVELTHALNGKIPFGSIKNREGEFVLATLESLTVAAAGALVDMPEDLRFSLTNAGGKGAYPVCGATWAVCYTSQKPEKARLLVDFLHWATHDGQELTKALQYGPLATGLAERAQKRIETIQAK